MIIRQSTKGVVKGLIANEHGTPIQNALVYLEKNDELQKVATSDTLGYYEMTNIKADTYTISVSYVGYFKKEIKDIEIGKGKKEIDIIMKELRCNHGGH